MLKFCFFLFFFVSTLKTECLIPLYNNSNRFSKIYVPDTPNTRRIFLHEIRNKDVFYGPTRKMNPIFGKELCSEAKIEILKFEEWKNKSK